MPALRPISHRDLVAALRRLGFEGPFAGGKHLFMLRGTARIIIPNPHAGDIGISLLRRILQQAGIDRHTWEQA